MQGSGRVVRGQNQEFAQGSQAMFRASKKPELLPISGAPSLSVKPKKPGWISSHPPLM